MRRIRQLVVSSLLAVTAFAAAPAIANAAACSGADSAPASSSSSAANRATLCLLNRERRAHGLRALRSSTASSAAPPAATPATWSPSATSRTTPAAAPRSATRIKRTGWTRSRRSYTIGENIGWGGGSLSTPRAMVRGLDEQRRPPRQHPLAPFRHDRHRHRQRRPDRRRRRDLRHRLRRLRPSPPKAGLSPFRFATCGSPSRPVPWTGRSRDNGCSGTR